MFYRSSLIGITIVPLGTVCDLKHVVFVLNKDVINGRLRNATNKKHP